MRSPAYPIDINTAPSLPITLSGWNADSVIVENPTNQSVLIRIGSNTIPASIADSSTVLAPPQSITTLPVNGTNFGVTFYPAITIAGSNLTTATLTFVAGEQLPQFGSFPVTAIQQIAGVVSIAANEKFLIQLTVNANSSLTASNLTFPANTTMLYVASNLTVNDYGVTLKDHLVGTILYNQPARPQGQLGAVPVPPTTTTYDLTVTNGTATPMVCQVWTVVGALPTVISPLEGFIRTTGEVLSAGFANYDAATATGDSGTYRWAVPNAAASSQMLVMDHAWVQTGSSLANVAVAITIDTYPGGVEQQIVAQILQNQLAGFGVNGPVYIPPGYQLRGFTQNTSGSTVNLVASAAYHWVPL